MINIPKGTKDVLPDSSYKWQYVEAKARDICRRFCVKEIRTPVFEHTELFTRSIGDETDVVSKEMYTFLDKGERSITLKPEGTAPVARSFVENSLDSLSLPLKMFYITPVFRYERPQAGRLREHHQFGVEIYGGSNAAVDFEAINLAYTFLNEIGVENTVLNLNSIGCPNCRSKYNLALKEFLSDKIEGMCDSCKERFHKNPLRILDCKVPGCKEILKDAPKILDYICDDCKKHQSELESLLSNSKIPYVINTNIVRGLDYYTKTVFEFVAGELGTQGTVCAGGRYDNLVESVGGKSTPCVGFGLGIERLLMLVGDKIKDKNTVDYFIISQRPEYLPYCLELTNRIREKGHSADTEFTSRSLKAQFKYADKQKAENVIVIGESEITTATARVKNLASGQETSVSLSDLTWL